MSTLAGSGSASTLDGIGVAAALNYPIGIAVSCTGSVYVGEDGTRIRKIATSGLVSTIAGSGSCQYADGYGLAASFCLPHGLVVDSSNSALYCGDLSNNRVRKISLPCEF